MLLVHHFRNPGTCFFYLTKTKLDRDLDHLNVEISKLENNSSDHNREWGAYDTTLIIKHLQKQRKRKKTGKSFDFPAVVAGAGLEPATSGL